MGGSTLRTAMLASATLAATLVGAPLAFGQDAATEAGQVDFTDPNTVLRQPDRSGVDVRVRDDASPRFAPAAADQGAEGERPRRLELSVAAGGGDSPVDVSISQRAAFGADGNGDVNRSGAGSEVRVGRNLVREQRDGDQGSSVYVFVASDNEALTWQPGMRTEFGNSSGSLSLQDRVEVGDRSAGVTYENNGVQASLAYVEREASTTIGNQSYSQDESFTGVTLTMRR